jgi:hypothetical protein
MSSSADDERAPNAVVERRSPDLRSAQLGPERREHVFNNGSVGHFRMTSKKCGFDFTLTCVLRLLAAAVPTKGMAAERTGFFRRQPENLHRRRASEVRAASSVSRRRRPAIGQRILAGKTAAHGGQQVGKSDGLAMR